MIAFTVKPYLLIYRMPTETDSSRFGTLKQLFLNFQLYLPLEYDSPDAFLQMRPIPLL